MTRLPVHRSPDAQSRRRTRRVDRAASLAPALDRAQVLLRRSGCALFGAICELPEYYPTRTERAIFAGTATRSPRPRPRPAVRRPGRRRLLQGGELAAVPRADALCRRRHRRRRARAQRSRASRRSFPTWSSRGIVADFARRSRPRARSGRCAVTFFYPGSSIGNFTPDDARAFSARRATALPRGREGSGLLIGVGHQQGLRAAAVSAYDDAPGVTAAFNRNVLRHVNRVIGTDFDPARSTISRSSTSAQAASRCISWHAPRRRCASATSSARSTAGEAIHTENSYKYTPDGVHRAARGAGFAQRALLAGRRRATSPCTTPPEPRATGAYAASRARRMPRELPARVRREEVAIASRECATRGVAQEPPRSTYWLHMNLPLYSPTAPAAGRKPG